jgi:hypothetical protein
LYSTQKPEDERQPGKIAGPVPLQAEAARPTTRTGKNGPPHLRRQFAGFRAALLAAGSVKSGARMQLPGNSLLDLSAGKFSLGVSDLQVWEGKARLSMGF